MTSTHSRKPAAVRRAEIEAAAEHIARANGLLAITMRAVAKAVGVTPTLVVHHVQSMDQLVADTFDRIVAAELAEVEAFAADHDCPVAALRAVLVSLLDDPRTEVTRIWVESWLLGRTNLQLAERVRAQMDAWRNFLADLIEAGRVPGGYRAPDSLAVAGQLLGMIDGLGAHSLVGWRDDENRVDLLLRSVNAMLGVADGEGVV